LDAVQGQASQYASVAPSMGQGALSSASWHQAAAGQVAAPLLELLVLQTSWPQSSAGPTSLHPLLFCWHWPFLLAICMVLCCWHWPLLLARCIADWTSCWQHVADWTS